MEKLLKLNEILKEANPEASIIIARGKTFITNGKYESRELNDRLSDVINDGFRVPFKKSSIISIDNRTIRINYRDEDLIITGYYAKPTELKNILRIITTSLYDMTNSDIVLLLNKIYSSLNFILLGDEVFIHRRFKKEYITTLRITTIIDEISRNGSKSLSNLYREPYDNDKVPLAQYFRNKITSISGLHEEHISDNICKVNIPIEDGVNLTFNVFYGSIIHCSVCLGIMDSSLHHFSMFNNKHVNQLHDILSYAMNLNGTDRLMHIMNTLTRINISYQDGKFIASTLPTNQKYRKE